jgi:hypothetical protein
MPEGIRIIRSEINVPVELKVDSAGLAKQTQLPSSLTEAGNLKVSIQEAPATINASFAAKSWKSAVSITSTSVEANGTVTLVNVSGSGMIQEIVVVFDYDMKLKVTIDGTDVINLLHSELANLDNVSNLISAWSPATGQYAIKLDVANLLGFSSSFSVQVINPDTAAAHNVLRYSIHYSLS